MVLASSGVLEMSLFTSLAILVFSWAAFFFWGWSTRDSIIRGRLSGANRKDGGNSGDNGNGSGNQPLPMSPTETEDRPN